MRGLETSGFASRSFSQFTDYANCSWRYRLQRVLKVEEQPSWWLPAGTAFHEATEWFDKERWSKETPSIAHVQDVWRAVFEREVNALREQEPDPALWRAGGRASKANPNKEDGKFWLEQGPEQCAKYVEWWQNNPQYDLFEMPDGSPAVEVAVLSAFAGTVVENDTTVKGYVDRVLIDTQVGALLVVDLKTGSKAPSSTLQLGTYKVGLEKLGLPPIWYGAFYMARQGALAGVEELEHWTPELIGLAYTEMDRAERAGVYLPNIGPLCNGCGVREFCVWQGGSEPERKIA